MSFVWYVFKRSEIKYLATSQENLSPGSAARSCSIQLVQLQRLVACLHEVRLNILPSRERMTKALIRLRGCAGWSAPLLFACNEIRHNLD